MNRRLRSMLGVGVLLSLSVSSAWADDASKVATPVDQTATKTEEKPAPFTFGDFSWMPGNYAPADSPLATKYFVPEIRIDNIFNEDFNHPADHTISGSSEEFRSNEFQTTMLGLGGDFSYKDVGLRVMTQFGMYSQTTPRNDSSPSRGEWNLTGAYQYISEAYASYHLDYMNGVNIQTGIFMSYIGLWSYYNFDNWTYQPSYVSSNTPWFFNGMRVQTFPTDRLKLEYWLINGWQSYGEFNEQPGVGMQIMYRPTEDWGFVSNDYWGADTMQNPSLQRVHSDNSLMWKYFENQSHTMGKAAASLTLDFGCQNGGGVACGQNNFLGFMAYNRWWFLHDHFGLTFGGGAISNPGRYLVLLPPINGATATSGTSYFTENPGDGFNAWDTQLTGDWMPNRDITFRLEYTYRYASVPYFTGAGGVTPLGGTSGTAGSTVAGWSPDLIHDESIVSAAMMIRY